VKVSSACRKTPVNPYLSEEAHPPLRRLVPVENIIIEEERLYEVKTEKRS
jgi:hypothetical protein